MSCLVPSGVFHCIATCKVSLPLVSLGIQTIAICRHCCLPPSEACSGTQVSDMPMIEWEYYVFFNPTCHHPLFPTIRLLLQLLSPGCFSWILWELRALPVHWCLPGKLSPDRPDISQAHHPKLVRYGTHRLHFSPSMSPPHLLLPPIFSALVNNSPLTFPT